MLKKFASFILASKASST